MRARIRSIYILLISLAMLTKVYAQDRTITGKVTSAKDGSPLPGANVQVKGTTRGTTTDGAGNYKLTVGPNATLVFSLIGMTAQTIEVGAQSQINISLADSESELSEVVVTALGIKQEQRALGYSVGLVKGQDIANAQRDNFLVGMQGRVAGLTMTTTSGTPGSSAMIQLRGASSIGGNNQPLFVVDGLPIDNRTFNQGALVSNRPNRDNDYLNRAADINPNDIESITVLKGPEAAALYGIDASSGAIVITTKKGGKGAGRVTYDNRFQTTEVYRFPETQTVYGRGTQGYANPSAATIPAYFGPKYASDAPIYDNVRSFFQKGFTQVHNVGFEGGSDVATYRLSTNYTNQTGVVPTTGYKRLSVRLTGTARLSPKLDVMTSLNYVNSQVTKAIRGNNGFLISLLAWPANDDVRNYLNPDGTRRILGGSINQGETDNPFFSVNKNKSGDITNRTIANFQLNYNPTPWLNLTGRFGADLYSTQSNLFLSPESWQGTDVTLGGFSTKGSVENALENSQLLNGNLLATLKKNFGKLSTSLLLGTTIDDRNYKVTTAYGERLYLPDFNSTNNTDPTTQRNKYTQTQQRLQSVLGSLTLNYDELLILTVTGRNDWSSTLPAANRSFFYPAASLAFNFSDLPALKARGNTFYYGKLRASYGQTGRDAPPYKVAATLVPQTSTGGGFAYDFYGSNPDLKPERGESYEVGTELMFFGGRLGLDFAYYNKTLSQQIVTQRLSYATGFIFGLLNGGTFNNRGVELQLKGSPVKKADFGWDVILNFSKLKTDVKNLPADVPEYYNSDTWLYGNARSSAFVSNLPSYFPSDNAAYRSYNFNYYQRGSGSATAIGGYSYARNKNGDILVNPGTGLPITNATFLPIGDRNPDFTIGLTNSFRYKSLSLSFLLDIRKGGDVFNGTAMYLWRSGLSKKTLDRDTPVVFKGVLRDGKEDTGTPTPNTIQIIPSLRSTDYYNSIPESEFVEKDINWLRLRDVTLSYVLPTALLNKSKVFKQASVFVNGTDLFLVTNYTGADPNVNGTTATSGGVGAGGIDFGTLSVPRGFSAGLRVGF
ncbi:MULTISPECIES: SusC/RagA family TonB-linked outer membrane protein [unclassified Spirosoma]|uniref:SusC/RagA family TonB-linked outer membrane protein n=1 Tax=unclassified Spirosoma TaxID=2621999 RepID=UPI0009676AB9|nr:MULTISPECIES: SusC/RagA family TonB-linked outer membrane protein [unclassified Spirosoma]MBN8821100.1 SusC/RagA family TonB-linked outer membrane protein [Spirosoma sp.]OJW79262.1 MAG: SusC/RagA family TonB-linked outer membrane protein [Spirosoma sp. 48-14]